MDDRRTELSQLREAFAECVRGGGRTALVTGGLASGKTTLLQAFADEVAGQGAVLLTAAGTVLEQGVRMGVVWQLLGDVPLPDGVAGVIDGDGAAPDVRAVHGLCGVLLGLAVDTPLVVVVDDLQFADDATLQVLTTLRRRARGARVMLVLGEWDRPGMARPLAVAELTRAAHVDVRLGPLPEPAVARIAGGVLAPRAAALLTPALHALSGGNPALVRALAADCRDLPQDADRPVPGTAFRRAVLDCLHRWDPDVLRVAGGLAVLGGHAGPELVAELLGMHAGLATQLVDVLTCAAIADGWRLRHPAITATVLGALPPDTAAGLHARAAELLDKHGVDAVGVARHLVAADTTPGQWAVRVLRQAAEQVTVDDAALAVRCLDLALRATEDVKDRTALRAALVRVAWRVNPSSGARHLPPLRDALLAGSLGWRDAVPVVRHLLWQGDLAAAMEHLVVVSATAGPLDVRTAAELRLTCEWIYGSLRDQVPAEALALLMAQEKAASANPWVHTALLHRAWSRGSTREVVPRAEHVLQGRVGDVPPEVVATALLALDDADRSERAMRASAALADEAARQGATTGRALLVCVAADTALRRGDLGAARAKATEALGMLTAQSWGVLIGYPLSVLILAETAMGNTEQATALLSRPVPEAMAATTFGARHAHASGHCHLAAGRTLAALEEFERCVSWARGRELDVPPAAPWRGDLAQALQRLGRHREARAYATEQLNRAKAAGGARGVGIALRVLASCKDAKDRTVLLNESVRHLERCADRLELARSLAELSRTHQERGQLASARMVLRKVTQLAKLCQADLLADDVVPTPAQEARTGADSDADGAAALSAAERKVAELAAHGHTNREIGRRLYITVSTVEQHLTRVYRKLNVARRTDLPTELPLAVEEARPRVALSR